MSRPHITQLTIGDRTVTFDEYVAIPTREERVKFRSDFIDQLGQMYRDTQAILDKIRDDAWTSFKVQTFGIPSEIPTVFTKTGKPDRRFRGKPNPDYYRPAQVRDQVIKDLSSQVPTIVSTYRFPYQMEEVMLGWERCVETPMERLRGLLTGMDWYSHYSDDYGVWSRGEARMSEARALVKQLGPEAEREFNRACPWLNEDGTQKKEAA